MSGSMLDDLYTLLVIHNQLNKVVLIPHFIDEETNVIKIKVSSFI
jgi:hypothetical protein